MSDRGSGAEAINALCCKRHVMELVIPSTLGITQRDRKLQVQQIGWLARTAAIFGAEQITIYRDDDPKADEERNAEIMEKYLSYAECPPYLRKQLIPRDPDLEYANILPPLQIISHGYSEQFREGAVVDQQDGTATVDIGKDDTIELPVDLPADTRITVMQTDSGWEPIDPADIDGFWTYTVENTRDDLGTVLERRERPVIGTSAHGDPLTAYRDADHGRDAVVVFGSAWRGIYDLIERGDCSEDQFDGIYDFIPGQETKTVRTSEAVGIVLGIINAFQQ